MQNKENVQKCCTCKKYKKLTEFHNSVGRKNNIYPQCKICRKLYRSANIIKIRGQEKIQREKRKDKIAKIWNRYYSENKKNLSKKASEYVSNRRNKDPLFKLLTNMRKRISKALKNKNFKKDSSTKKLLGCSIEILKTHLEGKFKHKMCWENYGKWHVDHIIPLASAKNETEAKLLFHYTNLQPLWAEDNLKKGSKLNFTGE